MLTSHSLRGWKRSAAFALLAISVGACDRDYRDPIIPLRLVTVEMSDYSDSLAHDIGILVPVGFKLRRKESHYHAWDGSRNGGSVLLAYAHGHSPNDGTPLIMNEARHPCAFYMSRPDEGRYIDGERHDGVEARRQQLPDGFQVVCGITRTGHYVGDTVVRRYIRIDRGVLLCEVDVSEMSPASRAGAWNICASIQIRRPHLSDPQPWQSDGPWTMELTTFADGWTGWRSVELSVPVTRPLDADEYWKPPKHWNPDTHDWERPEDR